MTQPLYRQSSFKILSNSYFFSVIDKVSRRCVDFFGAFVGLACSALQWWNEKCVPNEYPCREGPVAFVAHVLRTPFAAHNLWQLFQSFFYYIDFRRKVLFSFVIFVLSLIFIHREPTGAAHADPKNKSSIFSEWDGTRRNALSICCYVPSSVYFLLLFSWPIQSARTHCCSLCDGGRSTDYLLVRTISHRLDKTWHDVRPQIMTTQH